MKDNLELEAKNEPTKAAVVSGKSMSNANREMSQAMEAMV